MQLHFFCDVMPNIFNLPFSILKAYTASSFFLFFYFFSVSSKLLSNPMSTSPLSGFPKHQNLYPLNGFSHYYFSMLLRMTCPLRCLTFAMHIPPTCLTFALPASVTSPAGRPALDEVDLLFSQRYSICFVNMWKKTCVAIYCHWSLVFHPNKNGSEWLMLSDVTRRW